VKSKKSFTPISYQPYRIVNKWPPGQVGDSQSKMQLYNYFHSYNTDATFSSQGSEGCHIQ